MKMRRTRSRSVRLAALGGLSLMRFMAGPALAGGPVGGTVTAGAASISTPSSTQTVISQTSPKAIIAWQGFSIGQGSSVQFDNGSGATLNRVTGKSVSALDGLLQATGSVYLINPNGVIIGKSGVVKVGGSFVASTLDLSDSQFLAGGPLTFAGSSAAAVINYGQIGALGGDVALIAETVDNEGAISAPDGSAGLIAGYQATLTDGALDGGRFSVQLGGASTSVVNAGQIQAAVAELRASGGNIYALAGNSTGVIQASGVATGGGQVFLVAEGGSLNVAGDITARAFGGAGGSIETSASTVKIGAARIDAGSGGAWLLDPNDLTIDQTAANTIMTSLGAGTNVTEQTTASGTGGSGDITLAANTSIHWSTPASLTFSAYRNIVFGAGSTIDASGQGAVTLYADNTGTGVGAVSFGAGSSVTAPTVSIYYDPSVNPAGSGVNSTSYANPTETYAANVHGALTRYFLVNTVYDLQNITNNLGANYALGRNIDASATATWNPSGTGTNYGFMPIGLSAPIFNSSFFSTPSAPPAFTGTFDGLGHTISNLYIDQVEFEPSGYAVPSYWVGLFGRTGNATIRNLDLAGVSITGGVDVGAVAGEADGGSVSNVSVAGFISTPGNTDPNGPLIWYLGGLIGLASATSLADDHAVVTVAGSSESEFVGGLVGRATEANILDSSSAGSITGGQAVGGLAGLYSSDTPSIQNSYSSAAVSALYFVGGLVGQNQGLILSSYATGSVTGTTDVGGLVGQNSAGLAFGPGGNGEIKSSYTAGSVVSGEANVGGLAGDNQTNIFNSYAIKGVVRVYCQGSPCITPNLELNGPQNFGGLVGRNDDLHDEGYEGVIYQSYADQMKVAATYAPPGSNGALTTVSSVGGLVGYNEGEVQQSWASADIQTAIGLAAGSDGPAGNAIGGLIGSNSGGGVYEAYARSRISVYYSAGQSTGDYIGGLVGLNEPGFDGYAFIGASYSASSFNNLRAGGPSVISGGGYAGLVGYSQVEAAGLTQSYWDSSVANLGATVPGLGGGLGTATAMTTAQLQAQLPSGFSSSDWGQIAGRTYPYFLWQYPTPPAVISGTVSASRGGAAVPDAAVAALVDGVDVGGDFASPGGFYEILAPSALVHNAAVLTYLTDGVAGNGFADHVTGGITGLDLYEGGLNARSATTSLSGFAAALSTALGSSSGSDFLFTAPNGVLTAQSGAGFYLSTTGAFTVDQALALGSGPLSLTTSGALAVDAALSGGAVSLLAPSGGISLGAPLKGSTSVNLTATGSGGIVEVGAGTITTPSLVSWTSGATHLSGANQIASLSANYAAASFFETNAEALTVMGQISSPGNVTIGTTSGVLTTRGPISSGGVLNLYGQDGVTIDGSVSTPGWLDVASLAGDITINAKLSGGTSVNLAGGAGIAEGTGGAITTPLLNVSAVDGIILNGPNQITTVGIDHTNSGPNQIRLH